MNSITDLKADGVFAVAMGVNESEEATNNVTHGIYYPIEEGEVSYHYAAETIDANGNVSETFTTTPSAFNNTGKGRAIISLDAPEFAADGDLSEWNGIMPFRMLPDPGHVWGTVDDSLDYSAYCYVAMDENNLYVAIDVVDDVFSYRGDNTNDWWEDEAIEFFFGLYDIKQVHPYFMRGAEPDYRVVFKPYEMELLDQSVVENGTEYYYFEDYGESDYVIEAKIPYEMIRYEEDTVFTPTEGMTIPFEVFSTDADIVDGGAEGRVQLGSNPALNPWGGGPEAWTFAWVGMPTFTDVENEVVLPYKYSLENNYPNPFNPTTTINYSLANAGEVKFTIYNTLGQRVATLVNKQMQAGSYSLYWGGTNDYGSKLASGVYFYKLQANDFVQTKKMLLLK
jgi:hypothetical protein